MQSALETFNLNGRPIENRGQYFSDGNLLQYRANGDCINWMPFLPPSTVHQQNPNFSDPYASPKTDSTNLVPLAGMITDEDDDSGD